MKDRRQTDKSENASEIINTDNINGMAESRRGAILYDIWHRVLAVRETHLFTRLLLPSV